MNHLSRASVPLSIRMCEITHNVQLTTNQRDRVTKETTPEHNFDVILVAVCSRLVDSASLSP